MLRMLLRGWRLAATLVVIAGALVMCGLGRWQIDRHNQRMALNARIDARMAQPPTPLDPGRLDPQALEYARVVLRGTYEPGGEVVLRNREFRGSTGVHVLTPLRLSGSDAAVLIDRGWLPQLQSTPEARREFAPPAGEVTLEGVVRLSQQSDGPPYDPPLGPGRPRLDAWFRVNTARIQEQTGYPLLPIYIELQPEPDAADAPVLPARQATANLGAGSHMSYAVQWFSFALTLVVGYIALVRQQLRRETAGAARPSGAPG